MFTASAQPGVAHKCSKQILEPRFAHTDEYQGVDPRLGRSSIGVTTFLPLCPLDLELLCRRVVVTFTGFVAMELGFRGSW